MTLPCLSELNVTLPYLFKIWREASVRVLVHKYIWWIIHNAWTVSDSCNEEAVSMSVGLFSPWWAFWSGSPVQGRPRTTIDVLDFLTSEGISPHHYTRKFSSQYELELAESLAKQHLRHLTSITTGSDLHKDGCRRAKSKALPSSACSFLW